jgi:hypothetical protein
MIENKTLSNNKNSIANKEYFLIWSKENNAMILPKYIFIYFDVYETYII